MKRTLPLEDRASLARQASAIPTITHDWTKCVRRDNSVGQGLLALSRALFEKSGVEAFGEIVIIRPLASSRPQGLEAGPSPNSTGIHGRKSPLSDLCLPERSKPAPGQAQNAIRLERGHELYYRGQFLEESTGSGVQFRRSYRMEVRALVLDANAKGLDLAFFTIVKKQGSANERGDGENCSVRLELAQVDPLGRLTATNPSEFLVPLDGPATLESGFFVETPEVPMQTGQWWRIGDERGPDRTWHCLGLEVLNGISCLKLEGVQQSEDWDKPRADRSAWCRKDIVWLSRRYGVAARLERVVERREAAHIEPTQRCRVVYDLQGGAILYPAQLFEDRKNEILQARQFAKLAAPLLPNPSKQDPRAFDVLIAKIVKHIENTPATKYRDAVLLVKQRVEAAKRGESPPDRPAEDVAELQPVAALGHIAPDFVVSNVFSKDSIRLHNYNGRAVLMVFYLPTSSSAEEVLRFAERMHREHANTLAVLGFALSEDVPALRAQYEEFRLSFPIASGRPLRQRYSVDATPRLIAIDPDGYVRSVFAGWGPETATALETDIVHWIRPEGPAKSAAAHPNH